MENPAKKLLKSLFEYHHFYNLELDKLLLADRESAFEKPQQLFSHMLNAHQIWNARLSGEGPFGVFQLHRPEDRAAIDLENYQKSLSILKERKLEDWISYADSRGHKFRNTVEDILFHITNHHTYHRGQVMMSLREQGAEPLISDYIYYKRRS
ncbi:DinB family protein [Robertkochia aurantiaca]|uniref:DinB family protein n=1 Tax=Robertkochia aurantiaca TaxID=2873700 RepID=UPI001CCC5BFB|nr:DinB family protein [Robertkochia sp. 3YJGBD-33]